MNINGVHYLKVRRLVTKNNGKRDAEGSIYGVTLPRDLVEEAGLVPGGLVRLFMVEDGEVMIQRVDEDE